MSEEINYEKYLKEMEEANETMKYLANYVNYRKSSKAFIEAFKREHRTLQQSMFKLFLELVEEMATDDFNTDGRNKDSKVIAKQLLEGFKEVRKQDYINQGVSAERANEYVKGIGGQPSKYLPFI